MQIIGPALELTFASTRSSKNTLSSPGHFVCYSQRLPAFPCYQRTCHTTVARNLFQLIHLLTLPMTPTAKQSSQHCYSITAMAYVTCLTSQFNLGNLRRQYRHWHVPPTTMMIRATRSRFSSLAGLYTLFTKDILPQPSNLGTCHFMCS